MSRPWSPTPRTTKPRSASVIAISRPMPWLAPVTTATLMAESMTRSTVLYYETTSHDLRRKRAGPSSERQPSVHDDRLAVDVARVRRAKKGDRRGNLVRRSDARRRNRGDPFLADPPLVVLPRVEA